MTKNPTGSQEGASEPEDRATDLHRPEQGDPIDSELLAHGRSWAGLWAAFAKKYRGWWDRVGGAGPVYALPREIIESLAKGSAAKHPASRPLITMEDDWTERVFLRVCKRFLGVTVGVWDGNPIDYPLLAEPAVPALPPDSLLTALVSDEGASLQEIKRQLEPGFRRLGGMHHQMLAYVGFITFDGQYRGEIAALRARWANLPERPPLPLDANEVDRPPVLVDSIGPDRGRVLGDELVRFLTDIGRFMRKWRIQRLVTWDLPLPQGPLEGIPLGLARTILGPDHRIDAYPSYYDIPSSVDVRKAIRRRQGRAAADDGIEQAHPVTGTSPRDGHASVYESAFRMLLIEQSIRKRYGAPRGLVTWLVPVFAGLFNVSEDLILQLRRLYKKALDAEG
jgi:hypothetical protein